MNASRDHVDLWEAALGTGARGADVTVLEASERAFATRLRVGADSWVAARVALRRVLGSYLGVAPGRVSLATGRGGKPRLAHGSGLDLRFNLSHSGELALIALRLGHEVGVDVEQVRDGVDGEAIAREIFTADERARMAATATEGARERFFRAWVRREALAKATGDGIAAAAAPARGFTVRRVEGLAGYAAAVASAGCAWDVRWITPTGRSHPRESRAPRAGSRAA